MSRFRDRVRDLTATRYCFLPVGHLVSEVNRYLRGWSIYFRYGHPRRSFAEANRHTLSRLVIHLQRRSQRKFRPPGDRSFYSYLYEDLDLTRINGVR